MDGEDQTGRKQRNKAPEDYFGGILHRLQNTLEVSTNESGMWASQSPAQTPVP
jgi:hypothetical protein